MTKLETFLWASLYLMCSNVAKHLLNWLIQIFAIPHPFFWQRAVERGPHSLGPMSCTMGFHFRFKEFYPNFILSLYHISLSRASDTTDHVESLDDLWMVSISVFLLFNTTATFSPGRELRPRRPRQMITRDEEEQLEEAILESKGMLKDIKKKKLNSVQIQPGKQLSPAEVEAKQKVVRKLQVNSGKQGRIYGNPVADGWAGAVMPKARPIQKCDGRTYGPTDRRGWNL